MLMQALRYWSFGKVLLASGALFLLSVVVIAGWIFFQATGFVESGEGAGVGAVMIGVSTLMLAIPFIPPLVLIVAWLVARRTTPT
jgi:hypothetical protein